MTNLDSRIIALQEKVEAKKKAISTIEKNTWKTSCCFKFPGSSETFNIQTITDKSILHMIYLWLYSNMALSPVVSSRDEILWLNYKPADWLADIITRVEKLTLAEKKAELKSMEKTLESLLSNDAKAEKLLKEIESKLA